MKIGRLYIKTQLKKMVVETVKALLMIVNQEIKHRIQEKYEHVCLKRKRMLKQLKGGGSVQYQCLKSKAEIETDSLVCRHIKKLILE